jgi:hypothetical protein
VGARLPNRQEDEGRGARVTERIVVAVVAVAIAVWMVIVLIGTFR